MGLFSKILTKLGLKKEEEAAPTAGSIGGTPKPAAPAAVKPAPAPKPVAPRPAPEKEEVERIISTPVKVAPKPISEVDVVAKLEGMAAANPAKLNWKVSIVDLLKLLDLDSSFDARKELAVELGCPAELMGDSAKMNVWLHKEVLRQIAQNGGNIPKELMD